MQHPVPEKLLVHIGDITVSFALLENSIQTLIGSLLNEHQRIGRIVTAELAFRNLRALAISLYKERHGQDTDFETLKDLMKRAENVEAKRNQITHSLWVVGGTTDSITRIKTTAKEKHGIRSTIEELNAENLAEQGVAIRTLADDILNFLNYLIEQNKAINNPLEKTW